MAWRDPATTGDLVVGAGVAAGRRSAGAVATEAERVEQAEAMMLAALDDLLAEAPVFMTGRPAELQAASARVAATAADVGRVLARG